MINLKDYITEAKASSNFKIEAKDGMVTVTQLKQKPTEITPENAPELADAKIVYIVSSHKESANSAPRITGFTFNKVVFHIEKDNTFCFNGCTFNNCTFEIAVTRFMNTNYGHKWYTGWQDDHGYRPGNDYWNGPADEPSPKYDIKPNKLTNCVIHPYGSYPAPLSVFDGTADATTDATMINICKNVTIDCSDIDGISVDVSADTQHAEIDSLSNKSLLKKVYDASDSFRTMETEGDRTKFGNPHVEVTNKSEVKEAWDAIKDDVAKQYKLSGIAATPSKMICWASKYGSKVTFEFN